MNRVVLDASAIIAVIRNENGSDVVLRSLAGAMVSSVNLAEVIYMSEQRGSTIDEAMAMVCQLQIQRVPFDDEQAKYLAGIHKLTQGGNIGFADRACMALGLSKRLPVLTGDREWKNYNSGVEVLLFR